MKTSALRQFTKTVAATMSAVFAFTLIPMALGQDTVLAATAGGKDQRNTCLGTSCISGPVQPDSADDPWSGSYVYFGTYEGNPILFRVLAPSTKAYGGSTLFLDSKDALFTMKFDESSNVWNGSDMQIYLNGEFYRSSFTKPEQGAIAVSSIDGGVAYPDDSYEKFEYGATTGLSQGGYEDKVFLLDASEALNPDYGYSSYHGYQQYGENWKSESARHQNHIKEKDGTASYWWLRSAVSQSTDCVGRVSNEYGSLNDNYVYNYYGVAPALNINQSSIIFSSLISGDFNKVGAEYKLTIKDPDLDIEVPSGQQVAVSGTTVTVPYEIGGANAGNATRASILITDDVWDAEKANIILYDELGASTASSGTFTLPGNGWSSDYHVYILAEDINGEKDTDYASAPFEIAMPTCTVTYKVANGTWSDGSTEAVTETVIKNSSPASIPTGMIASPNYEGGSWDTDPSTATISADTTFTYTFDAMPEYTVTYKIVGGTWSDGSTKAVTETVIKNSSPASIPTGMIASSGYEGGSWDTDPSNATISADTTFTYTFDPVPTYTVTVQNDGNGTATADVSSGAEGTEVTLTATPGSGYQFKEWQVVSGGVTVKDNKFTIGTSDVTVKAVFEAKPADPVEPTSADPVEPTTADPVTPAEPAEPAPVTVEPDKSTGPFTYTVVSGGDATWTEGDPDLVVIVKSDEDGDHSFDRYEYSAIDGTKLTDEQAPASSGSTVITFKSDLLKTLSEGKHTILINFSDNSITTTVTIVKKAAGTTDVPSTGEMIGVTAIAGTVMILSACSMLILMRNKKREEEQ